MIFLCGNCQAKYQLPDERVAGRTVRMKCRKCAHLIEVKGPAPETSADAQQGWYAGIDGKPTGPMSQDELARKLEAGVMTGETLVWREGLDGWKPLAEVGELSALVAAASAPSAPEPTPPEPDPVEAARPEPSLPVSRVSAPPSRPSPSRPPPPRGAPSSRTSLIGATVPERDEQPFSLAPESSVAEPSPAAATLTAPTSEQLAPPVASPTAPKGEDHLSLPDAWPAGPSAVPSASLESLDKGPASDAPISTASALEATARESLASAEPVSLAPPLGSGSIVPPPPQTEILPPAPPRSRVHPAAWALVGLGGVLVGIVAGLSLAKGPAAEAPADSVATAPLAEKVEKAAPVASATPPSTEEEPPSAKVEATPDELEEAAEPAAAPSEPAPPVQKAAARKSAEPSKARQAASPQTKASAPPTAPTMGNLSSLSGLATGPTPGPSKTDSTGGGKALSQADVERVVQSHRAFVNRRCWELALATKAKGAPSSARVVTTIKIAPTGNVTSASATGGEGYPGLASCVAGQVRSWKFPSSEGGTVNIPFVFAAQ